MRRTIVFIASVILVGAVAGGNPVVGMFALQGGVAKTAGFLLATPQAGSPLRVKIDTWLTAQGSAAPIRAYDVDMTKLLHMIVVSDDFRTFLHVHPVLQPNGHFLLAVAIPNARRYYVYTDTTPEGIGKQVFRFALDLGGKPTYARDLSERSTIWHAGPYTVKLSAITVSSKGESHILVHIFEHGRPASNLHPYLGALAHAVFLNAEDLSYVHAHPIPLGQAMQSPMKPLPDTAIASPNMMLHVELHEPGTYKLWLQFRGGSQLYVAPFVISAT